MKAALMIVLLAFAGFSTWAMWHVGYFGPLLYPLTRPAIDAPPD